MLILNDAPAWPFWVGGAAVAAITLTLLFVANRRLGISSTYEDLCSLGLRLPYFQRGEITEGRKWRLPFALGLVLGGVASAIATGGWAPTWELGMFDQFIGTAPAIKVAWMFAGGILIGFGTRLAGGCTSGHGIFGNANLEPASLITTLTFMAAGLVTTNIVYRVILGG